MKPQDIITGSIEVVKNTIEFFSSFGRVNKVVLVADTMSVSEPLKEQLVEPKPKTTEELKSEKIQKEYAFFSHSRKRMEERYGMKLTQDIWSGWNNLIRRKDPNALFLYKTSTGGDLWRVWFSAKIVFVVFKDDMVITILPHDQKFEPAIRRAMTIRQKEVAERRKVEEEQAKLNPQKPEPIMPVKPPVVPTTKPRQIDTRTMEDFMKVGVKKTPKLQKMKSKYVTPHSGM